MQDVGSFLFGILTPGVHKKSAIRSDHAGTLSKPSDVDSSGKQGRHDQEEEDSCKENRSWIGTKRPKEEASHPRLRATKAPARARVALLGIIVANCLIVINSNEVNKACTP